MVFHLMYINGTPTKCISPLYLKKEYCDLSINPSLSTHTHLPQ